MAESGLMGVALPAEYGGAGASTVAMCNVVHEIAQADVSVGWRWVPKDEC